MAFLAPRAGRGHSVLRRNFQLIFSSTSPSTHQQRRPFSQTQLNDIPTKPLQIYKSTSSDPYINLSIEHHLLQHSHPDSTVLFLYTNRPCVVIGRNQNPWLEINLNLLRRATSDESPLPRVDIVRRRSGGGTVFHDPGNVNWSVICPPPQFDRDKHAEMVVRALRTLSIANGTPRVNERHDIVLDIENPKSTYKISGSAYKLTRQRSLHHGTCLLSSPFLKSISGILRSPAAGYIKARGVESVRSPVRNVGIGNDEFISAVVDQFRGMYGGHEISESDMLVHEESALQVPNIKKGLDELTSHEWIYGQTPLFTFSTHPTEDDPRPRPPLPEGLPEDLQITFSARHGQIQEASISGLFSPSHAELHDQVVDELFKHKLHTITNWEDIILPPSVKSAAPEDHLAARNVARWLESIFAPLQ
ncbi:Biotin/lipoate A/B protein ligase [Naviculisporaceae sp. PSN 640]